MKAEEAPLANNKVVAKLFFKSTSFMLGCVLIICACTMFFVEKQERRAAIEKARDESQGILDPAKREEILDRNLEKVPSREAAVTVLVISGGACILIAADKATKEAQRRAKRMQSQSQKTPQNLVDFISGKNDDLLNSKK